MSRAEEVVQDYRVQFDWRGETAFYIEPDRRVTVFCAYWGGPKGSVSHLFGVWEYPDDHRELLTASERVMVLERVAERSAHAHGITLEMKG